MDGRPVFGFDGSWLPGFSLAASRKNEEGNVSISIDRETFIYAWKGNGYTKKELIL